MKKVRDIFDRAVIFIGTVEINRTVLIIITLILAWSLLWLIFCPGDADQLYYRAGIIEYLD